MNQLKTMLYRSFRAKPAVYLFILISQIVSVLCIFFVIGLIYNSYYYFQDADEEDRTLLAIIFDPTYPEDIDPSLNVLNTGMFNPDDKEYGNYDYLSEKQQAEWEKWYEAYEPAYKKSRRIDVENLENGINVRDLAAHYDEIFGEVRDIVDTVNIYCYRIIDDGNDREWAGSSFYDGLAGTSYSSDYFIDNLYENIAPDYPVEAFWVRFSHPLTYKQQEKLVNKFYSVFNAIRVEQPEADLLEKQMSKSQQLMSAVLTAIVVANCGLCYAYIFNSRRKMFAIMRICGARKEYCFLMCMSEVFLYMAVSFSAAFLMFDKWLKNTVIKFYPLAEPAYTKEAYLHLLWIYFLVTAAIMGVCAYINVGKPIKEERS